MKINFGVLFLFFGLIVLSCKKETKTPENPNNTGGGNVVTPVGPTPSSATVFSGIFTTGTYSSVLNSTMAVYVGQSAWAYFNSSPQMYSNSTTGITVNKVYLNGDSLIYNTSNKYYNNQMPVNLSAETWSVIGANGIGTFSISNSIADPVASNLNALPNTISKSSGFSVSINNVANFTSAFLLVMDGASGYYQYNLQAGNNTINVTSANLSSVATTTAGYIAVIMQNSKAYLFSGKDYQFVREGQYTKAITINP